MLHAPPALEKSIAWPCLENNLRYLLGKPHVPRNLGKGYVSICQEEMELTVSPSVPSVCPRRCKEQSINRGTRTSPALYQAGVNERPRTAQTQCQRVGGKDQLEVWSIKNKTSSEHNRKEPAHTSLPMYISDTDGTHCPLPGPSLWTRPIFHFSREEGGFSGHRTRTYWTSLPRH